MLGALDVGLCPTYWYLLMMYLRLPVFFSLGVSQSPESQTHILRDVEVKQTKSMCHQAVTIVSSTA